MNSLPPGIVFILGAVLLLLLPRRMRSAGFLVFPLLAFALLLRLEPGASLTVPFLNYELVLCRVDRLSIVFGYVFMITEGGPGHASEVLATEIQSAAFYRFEVGYAAAIGLTMSFIAILVVAGFSVLRRRGWEI